MSMAEDVPQFPQYPPPTNGLPIAPPTQYKPLGKIMRHMLKSPGKRDPFHARRTARRPGKKLKYY